jgi:hypothetical protein
MGIEGLKIDTAEAFASISIDIDAIQRLSQNPRDRVLLEHFGINVNNFTPVVVERIELGQWIKLLQFYAKKARYIPARENLAGMKTLLKAG